MQYTMQLPGRSDNRTILRRNVCWESYCFSFWCYINNISNTILYYINSYANTTIFWLGQTCEKVKDKATGVDVTLTNRRGRHIHMKLKERIGNLGPVFSREQRPLRIIILLPSSTYFELQATHQFLSSGNCTAFLPTDEVAGRARCPGGALMRSTAGVACCFHPRHQEQTHQQSHSRNLEPPKGSRLDQHQSSHR